MDQVVLEIKNLCFRWKISDRPILDLPEFEIREREHVFLQGPSGSGKSTLLALIGGILVPESGELKLLGQNIKNLSRSGRDSFRVDHIGYIFQLFNLLPYLSIEENVLLPLSFSNNRAKKVGKTKNDQTFISKY